MKLFTSTAVIALLLVATHQVHDAHAVRIALKKECGPSGSSSPGCTCGGGSSAGADKVEKANKSTEKTVKKALERLEDK
jgi:hypothetical protein